jgi:hypothetical protein
LRDSINQPIVPVQLTNQLANTSTVSQTSSSTKLAAKIQLNDKEVRIYNGIDKYILYALLKELTQTDS